MENKEVERMIKIYNCEFFDARNDEKPNYYCY